MDVHEIVTSILQTQDVLFVAILCLVGLLIMWFEYVFRRWSWYPREKHVRQFNERF